MPFACWIAARPATPAPITSTLAGGTLPAAVNCESTRERPRGVSKSCDSSVRLQMVGGGGKGRMLRRR
eukprot:3868846-Rhodomonas_salina.1